MEQMRCREREGRKAKLEGGRKRMEGVRGNGKDKESV